MLNILIQNRIQAYNPLVITYNNKSSNVLYLDFKKHRTTIWYEYNFFCENHQIQQKVHGVSDFDY